MPDRPSAPEPIWSADFATGDFAQWSWWGQGDPSYGTISVLSAASAGLPTPAEAVGRNVGRMTVTAADAAQGRIHAKLYKGFAEGGRTPADVSGTYRTWYYIPSSYAMPNGKSANIFQFKEKYNGHSDPLWWVQLATGSWAKSMGGARWVGPKPARADQPVAMLNYWGNTWTRQVTFQTVPLDRWFEIRAEVHQGDRIDFAIDGQRFDTARHTTYPVTPFRANSQELIFGAGNYTDAPNTTLYLGRSSYSRPASGR